MNNKPLGATIFAVTAMMLLTVASAQTEVYNRKYCVDDTTLMWVRDITFNTTVNGVNTTRTLQATEPQICPNGCQNDVCMDPPWITYAWIFGVLIVISVLYLMFRPR